VFCGLPGSTDDRRVERSRPLPAGRDKPLPLTTETKAAHGSPTCPSSLAPHRTNTKKTVPRGAEAPFRPEYEKRLEKPPKK